MKKQLFVLLILLSGINCYTQITFEKGYFINNSGQKIDCLIKNIDWKNNPIEIKYKLSENDESKIATIDSIKEFQVLNSYKYKKFIVKIDRSSEEFEKLSTTKVAQFKEEQLLLKMLVDGKAKLYSYDDGDLIRFFFQIDSAKVEQLVYKSYITAENQVGKNNAYRQQLLVTLNCDKIPKNFTANVDYKKDDLIKYFIKYNTCNDSKLINTEKKQKSGLWNLAMRPGLNSSSLSIGNYAYSSNDIDFNNEFSFRFGLESEFIMPFNKNKWSILIEPSYQYYKSKKELNSEKITVDYKSIELPVGIRYYVFINKSSKIFINGSYIVALSINSKIDFEKESDLVIKKSNYFAFGIGYNYKNKYSLELRSGLRREMLSDYVNWISKYNTISVIFGYTLF